MTQALSETYYVVTCRCSGTNKTYYLGGRRSYHEGHQKARRFQSPQHATEAAREPNFVPYGFDYKPQFGIRKVTATVKIKEIPLEFCPAEEEDDS